MHDDNYSKMKLIGEKRFWRMNGFLLTFYNMYYYVYYDLPAYHYQN